MPEGINKIHKLISNLEGLVYGRRSITDLSVRGYIYKELMKQMDVACRENPESVNEVHERYKATPLARIISLPSVECDVRGLLAVPTIHFLEVLKSGRADLSKGFGGWTPIEFAGACKNKIAKNWLEGTLEDALPILWWNSICNLGPEDMPWFTSLLSEDDDAQNQELAAAASVPQPRHSHHEIALRYLFESDPTSDIVWFDDPQGLQTLRDLTQRSASAAAANSDEVEKVGASESAAAQNPFDVSELVVQMADLDSAQTSVKLQGEDAKSVDDIHPSE